MQERFNVMYAENDNGDRRTKIDFLKNFGLNVEERESGLLVCTPDFAPSYTEGLEQYFPRVAEYSSISDKLVLYSFDRKRLAVDYVLSSETPFFLVIMNRANFHTRDDIDGVEATRRLREGVYEGEILVQSHYLDELDLRELTRAGVNKAVMKPSLDGFFGLIVDSYKRSISK